MIVFATLLLGLVVGREPVELLVADPAVARVELLLDGRTVGQLRGEPWRLDVDFGPELEPHELVAVAYDAAGRELDRARQRVNVPRRLAEAGVVLEGGSRGRGVTARLTWASVVAARPESVTVWLDGQQVAAADPRRIPLPDHDPRKLHFLRIELDFPDNVSSVLELAFGGTYADQVAVDLTALPIEVEGRGTPPAEHLGESFVEDRRPLKVVAVEEGPAEILLVRDENARGTLSRIGRTSDRTLRRRAVTGHASRDSEDRPLRFRMALQDHYQVRFLWPFSSRGQLDFDLLSPSRPYTAADGGLYWLLTDVAAPGFDSGRQRLADAVAVAGLLAAGRNRRRAVVLILRSDTEDASVFAPRAVRGFLERLRVPLIVWDPGAGDEDEGEDEDEEKTPSAAAWGPAVDVSSLRKLERAVKDLESALDRQRIVWLEGVERPQDVELAGEPEGFRLVR